MRVLFDQGTPVPLRGMLTRHDVSTTYERGWSTLKNDDLLDVAEKERFEVRVTTDKNLKHQQNLGARRIAVVVLASTSWPRIGRNATTIYHMVSEASPGSYAEVEVD